MRHLLVFVSLFVAVAAAGAAASDPTYSALRSARPDGRTIALNGFSFERDVLRFTLTGTLHLLAPVDGKSAGAVFIGQGTYELKPATPQEQRQLAIQSGDDKLQALTDQFDAAVFLGRAFMDRASAAGAVTQGTPDVTASSRWDEYMKKQKKDFRTNVHVRLLQEILNQEAEPFFVAWLDGKKYPPMLLSVDPRDNEQTVLYALHDKKGGLWYSSRYQSELQGANAALKLPLVDPELYAIDATIRGSELSATTTMTFTPTTNVRLLPVNLYSKLRISSAQWAPAGDAPAWADVSVIQESEKEDADAAIVFPAALKAGQKAMLRIAYAGRDVLDDAGDGNYSVGARTSWYPNVAVFDDLANYELRFRHPEKMQVIAVGSESGSVVEGSDRVTTWKTTHPIRVAGFNYGRFKKLAQQDKDSGVAIEVYTNPGTPDVIYEINQALEAMAEEGGGPSFVKVDTARLAQAALADGINTARTGNAFFGPMEEKRVAITQQSQWSFGQSWPSLIYLPYVAFLNGTQRNTLGMGYDVKNFVDRVGPHEFAHQWWGHQIGWKTYRDQWLSEGFAEFTAALVLQQTEGWAKYNDFFERARRSILEKPIGAVIPNDQAGPITQGWRLSTWQNPYAYGPIVYSKGAYVLHMLRMAMFDNAKGDAAFMEMMKDFAKTYAGKNPSTAEFKRIVEKHATPSLKITTDGRLDWFFNQWVHGTAIPKYESKFDVQDAGGGKYKVTGSITQSQVTDNFGVVVPLYVHYDKKTFSKFASVLIVGNTTKPVNFEIALPKKPQKISVNALHDVLAR